MAAASEYVLESIRDGTEFTLYRARQRGHRMPLLAVASTAEQPLPQSLRRLEHEYSLAAELEPAWAAKPLALTRHEGRTILVLADPGGEPLDRVLERGTFEQSKERPLDLARFLPLAINLAAALGKVHQRGLIHKDVKTENVLVDCAGHVWLTGFGIASRLPRERQAPAPPEIIAGTLAYMSPEQTGRMNRSVDTRSDLYSLGVTLYQMLTGVLPFAAADPLEWVHCHIARQPVAPADRREIPGPLSAITMRLLAKNAEERYQTAAGLETDLRRCLSEWQLHGRIDPFPLGTHDSSDRLLIPEKLYGREREVDTLLAAFDRVVARGAAELVLVSGYSGVGKSSIVNELHKVLVPPRGLFAAGKFDQYKRDVPYATLAQAFQVLVRQILVASESEVDHWRQALLEALGPNGQLMVNLIPELEFIIGKQPPVAELAPQEARGRFQLVFRRFLGVFARPEHPLALFLDDLQWLDAATLELLERLITDPDVRHVLLIGAYRDNEVNSSHPLVRTLAAIRDAGARAHGIVLAPLGLDDVDQLVADALHCGPDSAGPLALMVYEKTGGNPFFAIQFLMTLAEEGLVRFDRNAAAWTWDLDRIRAKRYSDNVADLMLGKLRRLTHHTQTALQQLACVGNIADIALLIGAFGQSEEEIHVPLRDAVRAGLILRSEGSYAFLHDRIQEAAYALIPEDTRAQAHLRIGQLLLAHTPPEGRDGIIFEIVSQFNRSSGLVTSEEQREQVAQLNLMAGKRAKNAAAYSSALTHFAAGRALLAKDCWTRQYSLTFELEFHSAECEFLTGDLASAEERLLMLASRASGAADSAMVTCLRVDLYAVLLRSDRAVGVCLEYLKQVGVNWSPHPTDDDVRLEYERLWQRLGTRPIEDLIDLPLMTDVGARAMIDVLDKLMPSTNTTDNKFTYLLITRMVNISLQYGNSNASCCGYSLLGLVLVSYAGNYAAARRFGQLSLDLVDKRGLNRFSARVYLNFGIFVSPWTQHVRSGRALIRRAFDEANRLGDLTYAGYCCNQIVTNALASGEPLKEVEQEAVDGLAFAVKADFPLVIDSVLGQLCLILTLRGKTHNLKTFDRAGFDEGEFEQRIAANPNLAVPACWYWVRKLQARVFAEDYSSALEAAVKAEALLWTSPAFYEQAEYHFYAALARAGSIDAGAIHPDERLAHLEALAAHHQQLLTWSEHCPENFANRAALVGAELARLEGRESEAERGYQQAIHSAGANGFVHNEALACETAARFYASRGFEDISGMYLLKAREGYLRWGADGKARQMEARYPWLRKGRTPTPSAAIGAIAGRLDVETVVKASQAISSEIVLPELIEKLVRIAVENAGAERGLLILLGGGDPRIEAEATTGPAGIEVRVRRITAGPSDLPQSALHYVIRTQEGVLLDDASADSVYSKDEYVRQKRSKSILCLPIVKQAKLVGALYLENNLAACAFTPDRVTVLQLLASQAAISIENARLYFDLQREGQNFRLIVDSVPGFLCTMTPRGEVEFVNRGILDYTGWTFDQLADWRPLLHPDEREIVMTRWIRSVETGNPYDIEHRILGADGIYRWFVVRGRPARDAEGCIVRWYIVITDIDEGKKTEERLRRSEAFLAEGQRISHTGSFGRNVLSEKLYWSEETYKIYELDRSVEPTMEWLIQRIHPEDKVRVQQTIESAIHQRRGFDIEYRLLTPDNSVKYLHVVIQALESASGELEFVGAVTDITAAKKAEEKIRQSEREARQLLDLSPLHIAELGPDGARLYTNLASLDYYGFTLESWRYAGFDRLLHPQEAEIVTKDLPLELQSGLPFEYEVRLKRKDGQYRWFHYRLSPMSDEQGRITRWYAAGTDIHDRKLAQQRLQEENVSLREEVDKASMFEEIVGTSAPLKKVLSRISKVAPTESSVLITGETGTGKELVARAIHRRSRRSSHAFVSVNCAVIPGDLIASELFGHEKGAFTGATQMRSGRFELAAGGTLFLDEVGELPTQTQIALLRVLQEQEFERVGGTATIRTDVRVIAATNRDLDAAIDGDTFRSDLFYRLNVFPIEMPPLRQRREDIPLLVEYFLDRYARKAGKHFTKADNKSLDLLRSYSWPGNIRELQNVIERSVIVSESETFSVDESWLSGKPRADESKSKMEITRNLAAQEKEAIEAALRESEGRVSGASGAAARLGIPGSTLESKIKTLKINKNRFRP